MGAYSLVLYINKICFIIIYKYIFSVIFLKREEEKKRKKKNGERRTEDPHRNK